jgi:hypothetical protein
MPPPCTPPSSSPPSARASTAEKRGKQSSDEDGDGDEKGSGKGSEADSALDGSGDDDYRQVKSKRQKLKEKKKRQKAKKKGGAPLRTSPLLLPDEMERERLWILDGLKPSPEAIDQALADHPAAHPTLRRLLLTADSLAASCSDMDFDPSAVRSVLRRLALSPSPFTAEALYTAIGIHLHTL